MNATGPPEPSARPPLGALDPSAPTPLGRHSVLRRVVAEPVTALMIQRALVMDVAHPKVAAGVEDHSEFRSRPWRRAWITMDVALRLVFGPTPTARAAARQIYATHDHIHGDLSLPLESAPLESAPLESARAASDPSEPFGSDTSYTAHDASLLTWVWATLVDSAEVAYTRWVGPFSPGEADAYYADMVAFGRFVGIPADLLPADRQAFAAYLDAMIDSGLLGTGDVSRMLVRHILWFEHRRVPPPIVRVGRVLAVTTLDPRLRRRLDLRLDDDDDRFGRRLDEILRTYYPRLPRARAALPMLYVLARRPTIGLSRRIDSLRRLI
ncbi:MAG TPA: oxygenase MpaB family protein [Acidimicrobiales bacterium]|nr:oxygenase MpaB family protein [Acidimicrobiales bacterium]